MAGKLRLAITPSNMINVLEGKFLPQESKQVAAIGGAAGGTYKPKNLKEVKEMDSYAQSLDIQRLRKEVRLDG
ncbi:MAG: hypothetical protein ACNI3A_02850 [Desulfovibrio sp.]|uniref:hypothetical protein n=1 Tax=Desulfovibrio sp. 7SRBS1 TaxID=3378064 RepID=UPI003B4098B1